MADIFAIATADINGEAQPSVNGRDLHAFLEIGKDYTTWMKAQLKRAKLDSGVDYLEFGTLSSPNGGSAKARPQKCIEYALTLDAAKQVALISHTEKGKEVRTYLIEVEKRWRSGGIAMRPSADKRPRLTNPLIRTMREQIGFENTTRWMLDTYPEQFKGLTHPLPPAPGVQQVITQPLHLEMPPMIMVPKP